MNLNRTRHLALAGAFLVVSVTQIQAQMRLPYLIGDGMVIQRNQQVPIWGWSDPGDEIDVMFRDQLYESTAGDDGAWRITLPAMHHGGPYEMSIVSGDVLTKISDILIGDVWVCSGQSNMEWMVRDSNNPESEIANANDREIRHFKVPRSWAWAPEEMLAGGSWEAASPETVGDFTAVGFFFARELRTDIDVPMGLINTSWGGSRLEPWMSASRLGLDEEAISKIRSDVVGWEESIRQELASRIGELPEEDRGYEDGVAVWASPDLDDSGWNTIEVPGTWEGGGYPGMDGIGWYRTTFELSAVEAADGLILGVGMIDDSDVTWVNGHRVGGMEMAYNKPREYDVPVEALRTGTNVVSIWVEDTGGGGGIHGDASLLFLDVGGERRSLAGTWKFEVGKIDVNLEGFNNQVPTLLYNKMVYPMIDYPIAGALWYQGESNAGPDDAFEYRSLFKTMISQWREDWGVGDFPFLFVQLANYMEARDQPLESSWALLRESQGEALSLLNTAQAVIIDIGEAGDIHPRNKQDVGLRLSLAARSIFYEQDVLYSGPVQRSHDVWDGKVYLEFDHIGEGLELRDLPEGISGFAIAGPDSQFVWADAVLEGDKVVVWNDAVPDPVAVRYAWADNPLGANLYNSAGLPASPFRTDEW